jgi:hypothetical protein
VHIIGEIMGASQMDRVDNAFCAWEIQTGSQVCRPESRDRPCLAKMSLTRIVMFIPSDPQWVCVGGEESGQTQVDYPMAEEMIVWNHPIDLHYFTKSIEGWPKIVFEVSYV